MVFGGTEKYVPVGINEQRMNRDANKNLLPGEYGFRLVRGFFPFQFVLVRRVRSPVASTFTLRVAITLGPYFRQRHPESGGDNSDGIVSKVPHWSNCIGFSKLTRRMETFIQPL